MDSKEHTTSAKTRGKRQGITVAPHEAPPGDKTPTADSASPVVKLLLTPKKLHMRSVSTAVPCTSC